jgi:predicted Zn-dependent peptidase
MLDRTIAPDFKAIDHISLIKPIEIKLNNGCRIFSFNSGDQGIVRIEFIFKNLRFDPAKPLLNSAVNTMITEGTATRSALQIADEIDFYGAFLQAEYGYDQSQVTLYSLTKHLGRTLPVIKDILTNSSFPETELQTYVRNQQQKLKVSLQKNDLVARREFNKALYGNTIYGFSANEENYSAIKREDLLRHFLLMYQPANCTVLVAGNTDESILQQVIDFCNDWQPASQPADNAQPEIQPATERFYFKEKAEALQSAIRIGMPSINRTHSDFPALQVLNTVLGGYFGSRLMANIREDKGYTYGIGSGLSSLLHGGAFFIATEVGANVCRDALTEIEKEVNLLKTEPISEDELQLVRNYMLGSLLGSLENVFSHADKFKNIYFFGLDYNYYSRYTEVIKTITAGELTELANRYFDFDNFYKVIVGKY